MLASFDYWETVFALGVRLGAKREIRSAPQPSWKKLKNYLRPNCPAHLPSGSTVGGAVGRRYPQVQRSFSKSDWRRQRTLFT